MCKVKFYNENCMETMDRMIKSNYQTDVILTSPPYNTGRTAQTQASIDNHTTRYDVYIDSMTDDEYSNWTCELFNHFDKILKPNGVVLYNISCGNEAPNTMWLTMADIIRNTPFMVADCIIWKKKSALPNNVSHNKLTRITEFVFVIVRKTEYKTFNGNKKVKSVSRTGQKFYENVFNFIEAANNDGSNKLNKATYSTELCEKLLSIYATQDMHCYDPFMGTGTTAIACEKLGMQYCFGSELSAAQCEFSRNRLKEFRLQNKE